MVKLIAKGHIIHWLHCPGILCMDPYSSSYYIMIYCAMKDITEVYLIFFAKCSILLFKIIKSAVSIMNISNNLLVDFPIQLFW